MRSCVVCDSESAGHSATPPTRRHGNGDDNTKTKTTISPANPLSPCCSCSCPVGEHSRALSLGPCSRRFRFPAFLFAAQSRQPVWLSPLRFRSPELCTRPRCLSYRVFALTRTTISANSQSLQTHTSTFTHSIFLSSLDCSALFCSSLTTRHTAYAFTGLEITAGQAWSSAWNIKSDTHQQPPRHVNINTINTRPSRATHYTSSLPAHALSHSLCCHFDSYSTNQISSTR